MLAVVPFLQPFHGFPDHYYNMTSHGLRNLFERDLDVEVVKIPEVGHPIFSLVHFLNSYVRGLPDTAAGEFKQLTVADLMTDPHGMLQRTFARDLGMAARDELANGNLIIARKPVRS